MQKTLVRPAIDLSQRFRARCCRDLYKISAGKDASLDKSIRRHIDHDEKGICALTGMPRRRDELMSLDAIHHGVEELIRSDHPTIAPDALVSRSEIAKYRARYVENLLRLEKGELSDLERQVAGSIARHETLSENIAAGFQEHRTFGEKLSDGFADFGGSWTFIALFMGALLIWIASNLVPDRNHFDPFPFILLNLALSFLAALQAPVIMMSQKRLEAKDRLRSMSDYRVNLKAELEIRHLHEKLDHLLSRQWQRLADIQQLQIGLMEELTRANVKR